MLTSDTQNHYESILQEIRDKGLWKKERVLAGPQQSRIETTNEKDIVNLCANNYLGLSNHPRIIAAAKKSYDQWGYGLSSVRFICGTQSIHKQLEESISRFLGMEDTILYSSCFDANGGLFETLLTNQDTIISDELNHASIIDGMRLCKAKKLIYKNNDMADLEVKLQQRQSEGITMIATDGVFSMDGIIADLESICDLADKYGALVMVDDSHAVGFMGKTGRGTHEHCGVMERVDIITGTLGKALGGASGGYTSGSGQLIDLLRQRSRPYLFSNTLAPAIVSASLEVLDMLTETTSYRNRLQANTEYFRKRIVEIGFDIIPGEHPIVPVMLGDAVLSQEMADFLLTQGVYVIGFFFPVVPLGKARIRTQISAAHDLDDLDRALEAFQKAYDYFIVDNVISS
jgi:glycine C-acetyltransferase